MRSLLPNLAYVGATVLFLCGLWVLFVCPKWTARYFFGGLILTTALRWMIEAIVHAVIGK